MKRVLGIGNPYRHDDGAGHAVADRLKAGNGREVHKVRGDLSSVLEQLTGVDHLIVVDAVEGKGRAGQWLKVVYGEEELPTDWSQSSTHGLGLAEALEMAKVFGHLPPKVTVYGIFGENFFPGEGIGQDVEKAVEEVVTQIEKEK